MGIPTISSNLYHVDPKTGERITTPDSSAETSGSNANNDTFITDDAKEMNILQGMRDLIEFARTQKGLLDGAVPDEEFALERQGVKWSSQTVWDSNGQPFSVNKWYDPNTGETFDSDYFSVLENIARGETEEEHLINYAYIDNLTSDITKYFSTADSRVSDKAYIKERINAIIEEIRQNIAEGKENPTENLQTKFTLKGADWTLSELLGAADVLEKACSAQSTSIYDNFTIDNTVRMNYKDYAKLGMAVGYVSQYAAENLNKKQADSLNSIMQGRVNAAIARNNKYMEEHQAATDAEWKKIQSNSDFYLYKDQWDRRREYYSFGRDTIIATNTQLRDKIMEIFSSVGAGRTISNALNEYLELMKPVYGCLDTPTQLGFDLDRDILSGYFNALFGR